MLYFDIKTKLIKFFTGFQVKQEQLFRLNALVCCKYGKISDNFSKILKHSARSKF